MNLKTPKGDGQTGITKPDLLFLFGILTLTACIYLNSIHGEFILDDFPTIAKNIHMIKAFEHKASLTELVVSNRPVAMLSFAINYYFHQSDTFGYHLVNLMIHLTAGVFLYLFMKKTFAIVSPDPGNKVNAGISMAAVALWMVHPIQTQAVTYIVQRMTSMAAMFFILSMLLYIKAREADKPWKKRTCAIASVLAGLSAVGTKEIAVTLPFFILLYEFYFFQNFDAGWLKKWLTVFVVAMIPVALIAVLYLKPLLYSDFFEVGYARYKFDMVERLLTESRVIAYYLSLIVFPHPSRLNLNYDFFISRNAMSPPTTALSIVFLSLAVVSAIMLAKRHKIISFAIFWYLGNLVIESSFIPLELVYEHRNYLPTMLLFLVPAIPCSRLVRVKYLLGVTLSLVLLFSVWTHERNGYWKSAVSLYEDVLKKSPHSALALQIYAEALKRAGEIDEAKLYFKKSIKQNPLRLKPHYGMGCLLYEDKEYAQAIPHLEFSLKNSYAKYLHKNHLLLGLCYSELGNTEQANRHFLEADKMEITMNTIVEFHIERMIKTGKIDQAYSLLTNLLKMNFENDRIHNLFGILYLKQGELLKAKKQFVQALSLNPSSVLAHVNLGKYHYLKGNIPLALTSYQKALSIRERDRTALAGIGLCYYILGRINDAKQTMEDILKLYPDDKTASFYLTLINGHDKAVQKMTAIEQKAERESLTIQEYYLLGKLYTDHFQYQKAIDTYNEVLKSKPFDFTALNSLALISVLQKKYPQATEYYSRMTEYYKDNAGIYYNMACVFSKMNQLEESSLKLKTAIQKGYSNFTGIWNDSDLMNLRASSYFKRLEEIAPELFKG